MKCLLCEHFTAIDWVLLHGLDKANLGIYWEKRSHLVAHKKRPNHYDYGDKNCDRSFVIFCNRILHPFPYLPLEKSLAKLGIFRSKGAEAARHHTQCSTSCYRSEDSLAMNSNPNSVRFPLWQYLNQPLFSHFYKPVLNPMHYWYFYRIQHLERCLVKQHRPEENFH